MDTTVGQNSGIQELKAPALEREETENVLASSESGEMKLPNCDSNDSLTQDFVVDSDIEVVEKPGDTDRPSTEEEDEKGKDLIAGNDTVTNENNLLQKTKEAKKSHSWMNRLRQWTSTNPCQKNEVEAYDDYSVVYPLQPAGGILNFFFILRIID